MQLSNDLTNTINQTFVILGLTKDHADTYLSLLSEGLTTTTTLSKYSDIPRTTFYDLLEDLIDWGFVKKEEVRNRTLYSCTEPYHLFEAINSHKNTCNELTYSLKRELYQLEHVFNSKQERIETEKLDIDRLEPEMLVKLALTSQTIRVILNTDDIYLLELISSFYEKIDDNCTIHEVVMNAGEEYLQNTRPHKRITLTINNFGTIDFIKIITENAIIKLNRSYYGIDEDIDSANSEIILFDLLLNN